MAIQKVILGRRAGAFVARGLIGLLVMGLATTGVHGQQGETQQDNKDPNKETLIVNGDKAVVLIPRVAGARSHQPAPAEEAPGTEAPVAGTVEVRTDPAPSSDGIQQPRFTGQLLIEAKHVHGFDNQPSTPSETPANAAEEDRSDSSSNAGADAVAAAGGEAQPGVGAETGRDPAILPTPELKVALTEASGSSMTIELEPPQYLGRGAEPGQHYWTVNVSAEGEPLVNELNRYLSLQLNGRAYYKSVQFQRAGWGNATLAITLPPTDWLPDDAEPFTLQVSNTADFAARDFRLVQSALQAEDTRHRLGPQDFVLCTPPCESGEHWSDRVRLPAKQTVPVQMKLVTRPLDNAYAEGTYTGALTFAAANSETKTTGVITLYLSNPIRKALGVLLIIAGVLLGWIVSSYAPSRAAHLEALAPAVRLADAVRALARRVSRAAENGGPGFPTLSTTLGELEQQLKSAYLVSRDFLPRSFPQAYGNNLKAEEYAAHLTAVGGSVERLHVLVQAGVEALQEVWSEAMANAALKVEAEKARDGLDALATATLSPDEMQTQVQSEMQALWDAINHQQQAAGVKLTGFASGTATRRTAPPLTSEGLSAQLTQLDYAVWWIWLAITVVTGWATLILNEPGFGTPQDLLFCLLWGIGLPVGMDKLKELKPADVATRLKVQVPKTD